MRVADLVARTLALHGVKRAFGMPGGEVLTLIDALTKAGIEFILVRHETAGAIMAAGDYAATGRPGVLVTTLGPGLTNGLNGIADASQEHVPLIVLSGIVDHDVRGCYTHQVIDQAAMVEPLVKGSFEIEQTGAAQITARALAMATEPPYGPVHLDLAPGTAAFEVAGDQQPCAKTEANPANIASSDPVIVELEAKLSSAHRPLIMAGYEAVTSGAAQLVADLARRYVCPVATTYKAKRIVDENDPLELGAFGLSPKADKIILPLVQAADLIVLAGYDPIEMRQGWMNPFAPGVDVFDLSGYVADHGMHSATHRLTADLKSILQALFDAGSERQVPAASWIDGEIQQAKARLDEAFKPEQSWAASSAIQVLQGAITDHTLVTVDSGAHRILLSQQLKLAKPGQLHQSAGYCTMGAAVPLAAGLCAAGHQGPVIAVVGDGGLEMGMGDLATLRDQGWPVVIVVFQDESLALIELKQKSAGLKECGVRMGKTAFESIAVAFGGHGERVHSAPAFQSALKQAFARETFSIIVCEISAQDYAGKF